MVSGMRIGIVSDTHLPNLIRQLDELGPEPARFFSTVDLILHSGDLTSPMVLDWLECFAPVVCTTGNNDPIVDSRCLDVHVMEVHGWRLGMVHSLRRGFRPMAELQQLFPTPVDIMVAGDTIKNDWNSVMAWCYSIAAALPFHSTRICVWARWAFWNWPPSVFMPKSFFLVRHRGNRILDSRVC